MKKNLPQLKEGGLDESSPYVRKTKSIQFIDIFKKVGLINQAPTNFLLLFNLLFFDLFFYLFFDLFFDLFLFAHCFHLG